MSNNKVFNFYKSAADELNKTIIKGAKANQAKKPKLNG